MRYEKYRKIVCDCPGGGEGYADEAVLYFCEFFDRYARFYSVYPEIILVLQGDGAGKVRIPVKHKEDIIRKKDFTSEDDVIGPKEGEAFIVPFDPEGKVSESVKGIPLLVSGRCQKAAMDAVKKGTGLYYNDYFEFEAGLEYLLSKESLFRREVS